MSKQFETSIQNDDVLLEVLNTKETFIIVCKDEKDSHSKRVSLNNARRKLHPLQQRQVSINKVQMPDGTYGVKVFPAEQQKIWKVVGDEMVEWTPVKSQDDDETERIKMLMRKDGKTEEEIANFLKEA